MLSGRRKLLLADDSPTVQKVISLFLEEEGMEVVAVGDGASALRLLEEETPPDILIADVWMPGPDGYALCERVKSDERLRHIPVILLAGRFEPFNEAEARRVGADTVLTKPFQSIRDLVSRVGSLLGGGPKRDEPHAEQPPREETAASPARAESQSPHAEAAPQADARHEERDEAFDSEPPQPFADLAADDELIEAKPASSFFEPAHAEARQRAAAPEEFAVSEHTEEFETSAHAPDVFAASHGDAPGAFGTNGQAASHEAHTAQPAGEARRPDEARPAYSLNEAQPERSFNEARPEHPLNEARPAHSFAASAGEAGEGLLAARGSFAARAAGAASADDTLLDLGQFEPPAHAAEADDFILDLEEDLPAPHAAQDADVLDAYARGEQPEAQNVYAQPDAQNVYAQADAPSAFAEAAHGGPEVFTQETEVRVQEPEAVMQESEVVMQDEPQFFASPRPAHDADAAPRGFVEPSVVPADAPVPATVESEYTDGSVEGDVPKPPAGVYAAPQLEGATERDAAESSNESYAVGQARAGVEEAPRAGQLSREDVETIARRVVELMSERVVREIAWEVVPELAELLIKRKLEEERQK